LTEPQLQTSDIIERYLSLANYVKASGYITHGAVPCPASAVDMAGKVIVFLDLLNRWNTKVDLVAPAPPRVLLERHFADSWAAWFLISACAPLSPDCAFVDIGSGAGLPGAVFALLEPERLIFLCEPREKRVLFLKELRRELGARNIEIIKKRMEDLKPEEVPGAKLTVSRALGNEELFLGHSRRLVLASGFAVQMCGPSKASSGQTKAIQGVSIEKVIDYSLSKDGPKRKLEIWKCFT